MNKADLYYKQNIEALIKESTWDIKPRPKYRDGSPAYTKFITQVFEKYDLSKGEFPIPTLRNTAIKTGIKEILWIYQKASNKLSDAEKLGVKWWSDWDVGDRTIGTIYGHTVNQYSLVNNLLEGMLLDPFGRRHIMNLWQEDNLVSAKGLKPCAFETLWSCRGVGEDIYVDMTLIQRSNDYITAGFINKIQYVALQMMVCGHLGYKVGNFAHMTQNLHYYDRHESALLELRSRESLGIQPSIILKENKNFFKYTVDDFEIFGIENIPKITSNLELAI